MSKKGWTIEITEDYKVKYYYNGKKVTVNQYPDEMRRDTKLIKYLKGRVKI